MGLGLRISIFQRFPWLVIVTLFENEFVALIDIRQKRAKGGFPTVDLFSFGKGEWKLSALFTAILLFRLF